MPILEATACSVSPDSSRYRFSALSNSSGLITSLSGNQYLASIRPPRNIHRFATTLKHDWRHHPQPSGGRKYFGALMLGVYEKGRLPYVRHTATGFSEAMLKNLFEKLTPLITDWCPFTPKPRANASVKWVEPRFVCQVAFHEWTSDSKMRARAFLGSGR